MEIEYIIRPYTHNMGEEAKAMELLAIIPDMCRILGIEKPCPIYFQSHGNDLGGYSCAQNIIIIDLPNIRHNIATKQWAFYQRKKYRLRPWKPDPFVHVMAHELGHYKQALDNRLQWVGNYQFKWDGRPITYIIDRDVPKWYSYYNNLGPERDANKCAAKVIKELHREKYLYP